MRPSKGISWMKTFRLGQRFTFQQDNNFKHRAKIMKEWLHNNSVTVLEWPRQSPDLGRTHTMLPKPCPGTFPGLFEKCECSKLGSGTVQLVGPGLVGRGVPEGSSLELTLLVCECKVRLSPKLKTRCDYFIFYNYFLGFFHFY